MEKYWLIVYNYQENGLYGQSMVHTKNINLHLGYYYGGGILFQVVIYGMVKVFFFL